MTVMIHQYQIEIDPKDPEEKDRRRRQLEKNQAAIALLESWADANEEETRDQIETWEFLKRALDEDRLSDRKFFE